jgi:hypothetical protein
VVSLGQECFLFYDKLRDSRALNVRIQSATVYFPPNSGLRVAKWQITYSWINTIISIVKYNLHILLIF